MITGMHAILFSTDADADRAFLRDVLGFAHVDGGGGWLIFQAPPAEVAVHPTDGPPSHEVFLMCDDLDATLADFASRGVEVDGEPVRQRWGTIAQIRLPSGATLGVYEPAHPTAYDL